MRARSTLRRSHLALVLQRCLELESDCSLTSPPSTVFEYYYQSCRHPTIKFTGLNSLSEYVLEFIIRQIPSSGIVTSARGHAQRRAARGLGRLRQALVAEDLGADLDAAAREVYPPGSRGCARGPPPSPTAEARGARAAPKAAAEAIALPLESPSRSRPWERVAGDPRAA